jgi:hypothetical protein
MIKITSLITFLIIFNGCVNKHGVSAKYYSECKEYYDMQGYYHKECGDDDIFTYKGLADDIGETLEEEKPKGNVW